MSPHNPAQPNPRPKSPDTDQSSALERENKHVQSITESKDRDRDDDKAALTNAERVSRNEQDIRVETIANEAKEAGHGSKEPSKHLNKDG